MKPQFKQIVSALLISAVAAAALTACGEGSVPVVPDKSSSGIEITSKLTPDISTDNSADTSTDNSTDTSTDISTDEDEKIPEAVDLRNYGGKNYVTPVKRQAFGDCWSFGNAAAAESSYLYINDLGTPAGQDNINANFSERYLGWYVYHNITADDVKLGKVRASQVGEGYDLSNLEKMNPNVSFILGGASLSGSNVFASGFGPVDESTELNGENPYAYSNNNFLDTEDYENYSQSGDWSIPLNAEYRNPPVAAQLRNGNILPSPASYDDEGNYTYDENAVTAIKSEIAHGRAVALTALVYGDINRENWAVYTTVRQHNHVITVIGYDDNYPKENFTRTDSDGDTDPASIPPTDGAFIIKDSYGEMGGIDGLGTFYISYHDHTFLDPVSFEFDKADSVKYPDPCFDQYDLLFPGWLAHADYASETKMANVFDAEADENLYQIIYRTALPNTSVHYEIYKSPSDGAPDTGTLLEEGDNTHAYKGSHKIDLKSEYNLKKGEKYSVVVTMTAPLDGGAAAYNAVIPYASSMFPYGSKREDEVKPKGVINKGESFLLTGGEWTDLSELAPEFAKTAFEQHSAKKLPENFAAENADGIAVDNFPIKAVFTLN